MELDNIILDYETTFDIKGESVDFAKIGDISISNSDTALKVSNLNISRRFDGKLICKFNVARLNETGYVETQSLPMCDFARAMGSWENFEILTPEASDAN